MKIKKKTLKIVAIVLLSLLTFGIVFGNANSWIANEDGKVQVYSLYEQGTINSKGNNQDVDDHIRTKNAFACKGLKIDLDKESSLTYTLYFYVENKTFLGLLTFNSSMVLEDLESLSNVTYYDEITSVRIVIASDNKEAIGLLDYWDYINRIDVYVDAEQD